MKENDKVALSLGSSKKKSKGKKKQNSGVSNLQEPTIADDERLSTQTEPMEFSQQITEMVWFKLIENAGYINGVCMI